MQVSISTFYFAICISLIAGPVNLNNLLGVPFTYAATAFATLISAVFFIKHSKKCFNLIKLDAFTLLTFLLAATSILWTRNLKLSILGISTLAVSYYFAYLIVSSITFQSFLKCNAYSMLFLCIISIVLVFLKPSIGVVQEGLDAWRGVFGHKNGLGRASGIGFISLLALYNQNKAKYVYWFSIGSATCLTCLFFSKSGMVSVATAALVFIYLTQKVASLYKLKPVLFFLVFFFPLFPFLDYLLSDVINIILSALGRDLDRTTIAVRYTLWGVLFLESLKAPFLGAGVNAFWPEGGLEVSVLDNTSLTYLYSQAHNGYIELYLQLGLAGVLFITGYVLSTIRLVKRKLAGTAIELWAFFFLFFFLSINAVYSAHFAQLALPWFLLVCTRLYMINSNDQKI